MKLLSISLIFCCLTFSSCSTHFYKITGNEVTFSLEKPQAKEVLFFCSLDGYQGRNFRQKEGVWQLTLAADKPFKYFYRVDSEIFLPSCSMKEKDDFGSENCIFEQ